jgi:hypothetical protein
MPNSRIGSLFFSSKNDATNAAQLKPNFLAAAFSSNTIRFDTVFMRTASVIAVTPVALLFKPCINKELSPLSLPLNATT